MSRRKAPSIGAKRRRTMSDPHAIEPAASDCDVLDRTEKVLWSGAPNPLRYTLVKSWLVFLFGVIFLTSWLSATFTPVSFLFWIVSMAFLLSPIWHYMRAMRTTYVVTDQRAIIDIAGIMPRRISVPLGQMPLIDMRVRGSGSGDLFFSEAMAEGQSRVGFLGIHEVRRVEEILRNTVEASRRSNAP